MLLLKTARVVEGVVKLDVGEFFDANGGGGSWWC